jgi:predicted NBD/HSP70 family sugar kinase
MAAEHQQFQDLLDELVERSAVGQEVLGEVLARTSMRAPAETSRVEIASGYPTARRRIIQRAIPQGSVSKAVKALMGLGLMEDGEKVLMSSDGRMLIPLRLGSAYSIAGVHIVQSTDLQWQVTTAVMGLDYSRVFGTAHSVADSWERATELIYEHISSLKDASDQERTTRGLAPLRLFGVGVGVAAPVRNGEVVRVSSEEEPFPLSAQVRRLMEADPRFDHPVSVVVENDCHALTVQAIHELNYVDADFIVACIFDERVGGGLVIDSQLRRGDNGRAMEIGHLSVGTPPGYDPAAGNDNASYGRTGRSGGPNSESNVRCSCGRLGHVDTLATPIRIVEAFGGNTLQQMGDVDATNERFSQARDAFIRGGAALGRALAHVSNSVSPSRIIIYMPAPLADPKPDTAAAAYLAAVRAEVVNAFAACDRSDYLIVRAFPTKKDDAALLGAKAAAACVLESFIEHALRLDTCTRPVRERSSGFRHLVSGAS